MAKMAMWYWQMLVMRVLVLVLVLGAVVGGTASILGVIP